MILVEGVHKRYRTPHGPSDWVLKGVDLLLPKEVSVALIGPNGAGKSTLLRIIGGIDHPNKGRVVRKCRLSWPMGQGGVDPSLSGRQNAKFVCRMHGYQDYRDLQERIEFIEDFAEIGKAFDEPVRTYSSGMRSRLQFGLSLAIDFDIYISDEVTAAGDAAFKKKAATAFKEMSGRAGLIMVAHSESTLKEFCEAGIFLHDGKAHWFNKVDDALEAYKDTLK